MGKVRLERQTSIRFPESMFSAISAFAEEDNLPVTTEIRIMLREAIYNRNTRKRLNEATAAHDKDEIMKIGREIGLVYSVNNWAREDEIAYIRASARGEPARIEDEAIVSPERRKELLAKYGVVNE